MCKSNQERKTVKKRYKKGRRYSPAEKEQIIQDSEFKTYKELNDIYGVSSESVRLWKKYGHLKSAQQDPVAEEGHYSGDHPHWKKALWIWRIHPGLGPAQISNQMHKDGIEISVSTVRNILLENGYTPPKTIIKDVSSRRFEAAWPREIIHLDFKHFYINKQKVYVLFFQDDYSRFICGYQMTNSENMEAVIGTFERCIQRYGKMQSLLTDGGSAFYSWNGLNKFQRLISEEYGINQIKAGSPRTNGKLESVNKQFEKEVLKVKNYSSLLDLEEAVTAWIKFYNFQRTHMGLPKGVVPADRFLYGWNEIKGDQEDKPAHNNEILEILKLALNKIK